MSNHIQTAVLDWQRIDGIDIPISTQFGDVYFSKDNGLLETRHVFLAGNELETRLASLSNHDYFCVAETGFGTGLNILALMQLWQKVRPNNHSHLHAISVEKYPLTQADLRRALAAWPELSEFSTQLIEQYPLAIAGCHRLHFPEQRFSLDLWLGDAQDVFPNLAATHYVDAWFLDGFAPSCNPELWEEKVLDHIIRLSTVGTTFASFSVAGVLKRGLSKHGIQISRPRGFGHKREMLKAIWPDPHVEITTPRLGKSRQQQRIAVIGAGVAGLSVAWAFAQRHHQIDLFDQNAPLAGASGNPLALLNPKLCPIAQSHEHLMTLSWQYAQRHYQQFTGFRPLSIYQLAQKDAENLLELAEQYPSNVVTAHRPAETPLSNQFASLCLNQAGAIVPKQLAEQILAHPNIQFHCAQITAISATQTAPNIWQLQDKQNIWSNYDQVIVCCAKASATLFQHNEAHQYPALKAIRGQVSWLNNAGHTLALNQAFSYGGYCMQLDQQQLILGASFYPNREDDQVLEEDHVHNYELIHSVAADFAQQLAPIIHWSGRASIRAQSPDYFPLVGAIPESQATAPIQQPLYTFAGLGSKGFLFAPLCSEVLAALVLAEACPIPQSLVHKLDPQRFRKKVKQKKPYFSKTTPAIDKEHLN
ncbi:bifunctional tRNA (5-methylaminomethyl-2-thiouridine)(34)-methyltransferase MnmD/FAD-dependent 5-carboxymethylaminomethyl-2-thiouridine(34) oxidoreductase MnmC [Acinetobacter rudis]|uniref:bifunctional tRNA (5-methylaminomethyl-2-thiouridine)(34)-methyltransferase MnmD/FAD-dependent 5-carboxymethylaminomethyl-2-thiouridine(34) oxidoreductase MnmC n=1 Tax=Acinetobacter rudis TaxID=632955 RepID=UPI00280CBE3A|nr:bifunctional tRNA (5-methylaminomethyl-2-thiouridine)(34)-methyltransferase MnmD/FAD-dependent 5-carboxymethylaminomethyl-2-thiouridine(34) oxidoreductase MnmC [Acinetobacter rudis]MDQ8952920.1 bifunctional tRNA (5-methylaminomethyl-2-thiouridine)(34)-methyltransferase MnmD/FAD-dependent 5-carboxymethylaminomethyl-2-thiouridine(34) oxidoreductase MnmC [Acinetobacter rudis]